MVLKSLIFLLCLFSAPILAAQPNPSLNTELKTILSNQHLQQSKVGIYAVDLATGEVLLSHEPDALLNPASNMKLVTGATALSVLGPEYTVFTRLSHDGKRNGKTIEGNLYLKSDGDPFLHHQNVVSWALDIKRQGIDTIAGDLVIDDTRFAGTYIPPGFDQKAEDAAFRAPVGAVSVSYNAVTVEVHPGKEGAPAEVRVFPPNDYVRIVNNVTTKAGKRSAVNFSVKSDGDFTQISLTGNTGLQAEPVVVRKRIDHPGLFSGHVMATALKEVGISISGTIRTGARPDNTRTLVLYESSPMWSNVALMNKWSNNFMAEVIFRQLAMNKPVADIESSRQVVAEFLAAAKVTPGWTMFNGSGLYNGNKFSARQLVQILSYMHNHPFSAEFEMSLAMAGRDGTMKTRMPELNNNLRAKTGTLNEVTSLAGYVTSVSGRRIAYAVIFNDTPVRSWNLRSQQDAVITLLANFKN